MGSVAYEDLEIEHVLAFPTHRYIDQEDQNQEQVCSLLRTRRLQNHNHQRSYTKAQCNYPERDVCNRRRCQYCSQ